MKDQDLRASFGGTTAEPFPLTRWLVWPRDFHAELTDPKRLNDFGFLYPFRVKIGSLTAYDTVEDLNVGMREAVQTPGVVRVIVPYANPNTRAALRVGGGVSKEADARLFLHETGFNPFGIAATFCRPEKKTEDLLMQPKDERKYPSALQLGERMLSPEEQAAYWVACHEEHKIMMELRRSGPQTHFDRVLLGME